MFNTFSKPTKPCEQNCSCKMSIVEKWTIKLIFKILIISKESVEFQLCFIYFYRTGFLISKKLMNNQVLTLRFGKTQASI